MATKKASSRRTDGMRREYNVGELRNPIRGKYYDRAMKDTTVIPLDPDVAEAFPDAKAVNDALRALLAVARTAVASRRRGRRSATRR